MPWRGMSPVDLRLEFMNEYRSGLFSMIELADQYGISRKTAYKWVARYAAEGPSGLLDRSRRPRQSPDRTAPDVVAELVAARRRHPYWGARKLLAWLAQRQPDVAWPTRSTACDLLNRAGLIRTRRRRRPPAPIQPRAPITAPNDVWTVDFKGQFRTGDGHDCDPLTLRDAFSRYVLRCDGLPGPLLAPTRALQARVCRVWPADAHSQRQWSAVCGPRSGAVVATGSLVDAPRHHARADRPRASRAEWLARAIPFGAEAADRPAAGAHHGGATAPVRALLSRVQRRTPA